MGDIKMSSVQPTDHFCVRDVSKSVGHLAFTLQISIPHDIISAWLDYGCDWLNYVAIATISVTWLVYATYFKKRSRFSFHITQIYPSYHQKAVDLKYQVLVGDYYIDRCATLDNFMFLWRLGHEAAIYVTKK